MISIAEALSPAFHARDGNPVSHGDEQDLQQVALAKASTKVSG